MLIGPVAKVSLVATGEVNWRDAELAAIQADWKSFPLLQSKGSLVSGEWSGKYRLRSIVFGL